MMNRATLNNKELETELTQNGFIHIRNFISPDEVKQLMAIYKDNHPQSDADNGMWNSLYNAGIENGLKISAEILQILKPRLTELFESYYAPVATFMSKNCNENSTCTLHRDFSTADETLFQYRNIWIPLVDTTYHNGALYVVKGSNKIFTYPLPMFSKWPYQAMEHELFKTIQTVECTAGDLVIYLDKTLHGSHNNRSNDSRPAVHFGALHPDTKLLFYFLDTATNKVRTYEVPYQFYFENNFTEEPVGRFPLYSEFDYTPPQLKLEDIIRQVANE